MFEYAPYYRNYPQYGYQGYNYYSKYGSYHPIPTYTANSTQNHEENIDSNINVSNENMNINQNDFFKEAEPESEKGFRLGPISINSEKIDIFGFSIALDDLIIIAVILLLFFQSERDYTLLIVLGLMLFNITISSLDLF